MLVRLEGRSIIVVVAVVLVVVGGGVVLWHGVKFS